MLKRFRAIWDTLAQKNALQLERQVATIGEKHYVIRELRTEDIKALIEVQREVYRGNLPWSRSAFVSELVSPLPHLYLCAEYKQKIVAFCGCRINGNDGHVTYVAVLPNYQGMGIGTWLLQQLETFAKSRGCLTMSLEVRLSNRDAQRLYRKLGYVSRAIKEGYYDETNEDALDMVKYIEE